MKENTSQEEIAKAAAPAPETAVEAGEDVLSRKELDHFFSVYFELRDICEKLTTLKDMPGDLAEEIAKLNKKYKKVNFSQIDADEYESVKALCEQALQLWGKVLAIKPDAAKESEFKKIDIDDVQDALAIPPDQRTGKRNILPKLIIPFVILLVFAAIICVTVPLPWVYNALGSIFYYGRVVDQDHEEGAKWFRKGAEKGYAKAQFNLGLCYETGNGVEQDYAEAVKWFRKAADQGLDKAQYSLARCLDEGRGCERNYDEAVEWYRRAAAQDHAASLYNLGLYYENTDSEENHYEMAFHWYTQAAEQNYVKAQCNLGYLYHNGLGTKKDLDKAREWYTKAAEKGDATAQYNLAMLCLDESNGKKANYHEAAKWLRKSANQDNEDAQFALAQLYESGKGVKKDLYEALRWYTEAGKNGHKGALAATKDLILESGDK